MKPRANSVSSTTLAFAFAGVVLAYVAGCQLWYGHTPLGLVPVTDDRELLALARQIAGGSLPHEAFYRAPGYSALLALALKLGWPDAGLLGFARLLNSLCHLLTTALCFQLASRLWQRPAAAYLAASLVGFNPVLLHFAGDALDITLALSLLMLALCALVPRNTQVAKVGQASLWLAAASLCRPQLLPLCALPALLALSGGRRERPGRLARATLPGLLVMLLFGAINFQLAGDFRMLPWQGAYNLWAANTPGANGRYFEQTLVIDSYDESSNPARLESEARYRQLVPDAPADYITQSHFWRARTLAAIAADPAAWLALMTTKLRYLLSGEEQYNNKTYAFHKARSPWLRFNPIGWTLIFALAMTALGLHAGAGGVRVPVLACLLIAGGVLLFYVSDRFRAPLVPVLAVLAGGICRWRPGLPLQRAAASGLIALALACFPVDYDPRETETQDHLLLATSANALGRYAEALREIDAARAPSRPAVITLRCVVGFNAWLTAISTDEAGWTADCRRAAAWSAIARLQTAHADWRAGHTREAVAGWRELAQRTGSLQTGALAGLWQAGALDELTAGRVKALLEQGDVLLLGVAASQGDGQAARRLTDLLGASAAAREQAAVARLWGAPGAMRPRRD